MKRIHVLSLVIAATLGSSFMAFAATADPQDKTVVASTEQKRMVSVSAINQLAFVAIPDGEGPGLVGRPNNDGNTINSPPSACTVCLALRPMSGDPSWAIATAASPPMAFAASGPPARVLSTSINAEASSFTGMTVIANHDPGGGYRGINWV